jgi:hypothetical protein
MGVIRGVGGCTARWMGTAKRVLVGGCDQECRRNGCTLESGGCWDENGGMRGLQGGRWAVEEAGRLSGSLERRYRQSARSPGGPQVVAEGAMGRDGSMKFVRRRCKTSAEEGADQSMHVTLARTQGHRPRASDPLNSGLRRTCQRGHMSDFTPCAGWWRLVEFSLELPSNEEPRPWAARDKI